MQKCLFVIYMYIHLSGLFVDKKSIYYLNGKEKQHFLNKKG